MGYLDHLNGVEMGSHSDPNPGLHPRLTWNASDEKADLGDLEKEVTNDGY
jgi:hypothetical protein